MVQKFLLMCAVAAGAALWSPPPQEQARISIGDELQLTDAFHPEELSAKARVETDGTVRLPELGFVRVAGLNRTELHALLTEKYSAYYDLLDIEVCVEPAEKRYYVLGDVEQEGERAFEGDLNVFEAVLLNRPNLRAANLGRVRVIRPDGAVIDVDIAEMIQTGDSSYNIQLRDRDIVYVPPNAVVQPSVADLLARASAEMEACAQRASAADAEYVRKLITTLSVVSEDYQRVAR